MGRCATCRKRIGTFGRKWRRLEGGKYCLQCASTVILHRRQKAMDIILSDPKPVVVLAAPAVSGDPDYPSSYRRYAGVLLLSNKGLIFATRYEYKQADFTSEMAGVFLGAPAGVSKEQMQRKKEALSVLGNVDIANPIELLDQAAQLFLFGLDDIAKMKANGRDCRIKLHGSRFALRWINPRQYIKPHRFLLDTYVQAVNDGRDVLIDCKALM